MNLFDLRWLMADVRAAEIVPVSTLRPSDRTPIDQAILRHVSRSILRETPGDSYSRREFLRHIYLRNL